MGKLPYSFQKHIVQLCYTTLLISTLAVSFTLSWVENASYSIVIFHYILRWEQGKGSIYGFRCGELLLTGCKISGIILLGEELLFFSALKCFGVSYTIWWVDQFSDN